MGHSQRKLIPDGIDWALQAAGAAVPAFDRIINEGFLLAIRPVKDVAGTDLVAIPTFDAFLSDNRRHQLSLRFTRIQ